MNNKNLGSDSDCHSLNNLFQASKILVQNNKYNISTTNETKLKNQESKLQTSLLLNDSNIIAFKIFQLKNRQQKKK